MRENSAKFFVGEISEVSAVAEIYFYPDSPNHADFPSTELKAGQGYAQTTVYKFLPLRSG